MSGTASQQLKNEIVRAGAGAGKTYTLTHKVVDLADHYLQEHKRLPRLVVTTFTRKATQELRERLMLLALDERPHLIDFVNSKAHLTVSTMHGVMDLYLKRYGAALGIDPAYQIMSRADSRKLARQVLRQLVFRDGAHQTLVSHFSFDQLATLTRTLSATFAESSQVAPYSEKELRSIFNSQAKTLAHLMSETSARVRAESTNAPWLKLADEFQSLAELLLAGEWNNERRDDFLAKIDSLTGTRKSAQAPDEETIDMSKECRAWLKKMDEPLYDPTAWVYFAERFGELDALGRDFHAAFVEAKRRLGQIEINDLEHLAKACASQHPETAAAFAEEWDHWLIDEFQDTSPLQIELIRALSGSRPNFIVGDPQQSIYLFRGARSEVFGEREKEILRSGGDQHSLTMNRRSQPELLMFFNDFFTRQNPPFQAMTPFLEEGQAPDPTKTVAKFVRARNSEDEELAALVDHVRGLLAAGATPDQICILGRTNAALLEVAKKLSAEKLPIHLHAAAGFYDRREIRDALALLKFFANPHDDFNLIELLRSPWYRHPDDKIAHALPRERSARLSFWQALLETEGGEDSKSRQENAVLLLQRRLEQTRIVGYSAAFLEALIADGFFDLARHHDISGRREANLWKLVASLRQAENSTAFNPLAFVRKALFDLQVDEENSEGDAVAAVEPNRINLMTVHASKGLEFKHVLVPKMDSRPQVTNRKSFTVDEDRHLWAARIPYGEDSSERGSLAESVWIRKFNELERAENARVLYVALTRASVSVYLSWTLPEEDTSWASLVPLDLSLGRHQTAHYAYEVIDAPTLLSAENSPNSQAASSETVNSTVSPRAPWRPPTPTSVRRSRSVSEMIEEKGAPNKAAKSNGSEAPLANLLRSAARGTAVHRLMELLKYPTRFQLERLLQKWFPGQEDAVLEAIEFVRSSSEPSLLQIIHNGEVEFPFAFVENGTTIEGQIDLWGRDDNGKIWVIDYKTGNPENVEKAFQQMEIYARALRVGGFIAEGDSVALAAVYPFARKVFCR